MTTLYKIIAMKLTEEAVPGKIPFLRSPEYHIPYDTPLSDDTELIISLNSWIKSVPPCGQILRAVMKNRHNIALKVLDSIKARFSRLSLTVEVGDIKESHFLENLLPWSAIELLADLKTIDIVLQGCPELNEDMVTHFLKSLCNDHWLHSLSVSGLQFSSLTVEQLEPLKALHYIKFDNCGIKFIAPEGFKSFSNLRGLCLSNNLLEKYVFALDLTDVDPSIVIEFSNAFVDTLTSCDLLSIIKGLDNRATVLLRGNGAQNITLESVEKEIESGPIYLMHFNQTELEAVLTRYKDAHNQELADDALFREKLSEKLTRDFENRDNLGDKLRVEVGDDGIGMFEGQSNSTELPVLASLFFPGVTKVRIEAPYSFKVDGWYEFLSGFNFSKAEAPEVDLDQIVAEYEDPMIPLLGTGMDAVTHLHWRNSSIDELSIGRVFPALTQLNLYGEIFPGPHSRVVPAYVPDRNFMFFGAPNLKHIKFDAESENTPLNFPKIPEYFFYGANRIETIRLQMTTITLIHPKAFEPIKEALKYMDLSYSSLTEVPPAIFTLRAKTTDGMPKTTVDLEFSRFSKDVVISVKQRVEAPSYTGPTLLYNEFDQDNWNEAEDVFMDCTVSSLPSLVSALIGNKSHRHRIWQRYAQLDGDNENVPQDALISAFTKYLQKIYYRHLESNKERIMGFLRDLLKEIENEYDQHYDQLINPQDEAVIGEEFSFEQPLVFLNKAFRFATQGSTTCSDRDALVCIQLSAATNLQKATLSGNQEKIAQYTYEETLLITVQSFVENVAWKKYVFDLKSKKWAHLDAVVEANPGEDLSALRVADPSAYVQYAWVQLVERKVIKEIKIKDPVEDMLSLTNRLIARDIITQNGLKLEHEGHRTLVKIDEEEPNLNVIAEAIAFILEAAKPEDRREKRDAEFQEGPHHKRERLLAG